MKPLLPFFLFFLLWSSFGICNGTPPPNAQSVDVFQPNWNTSNEMLLLEMPFSKAQTNLPNQAEELNHATIKRITYVFTKNNNPSFDQGKLDNSRLQRLKHLLPQLANSTEIEWLSVEQNNCNSESCARKQFHGFVLEYAFEQALSVSNLPRQRTVITAQSGASITGKKGTQLIVPPNAFVDAAGNLIQGQVDVVLREALSPTDIIAANLQTATAQGKALESGGMLEITAYQHGRPLQLASGKSIEVTVTPKEYKPGMQLYEGKRVAGKLVWDNPVPLNEPVLEEQKSTLKRSSVVRFLKPNSLENLDLDNDQTFFQELDYTLESKSGYWGFSKSSVPKGFYPEKPEKVYTDLIYSEWVETRSTRGRLIQAEVIHVLNGDTIQFTKKPNKRERNNFVDRLSSSVATGYGNWLNKWLWPIGSSNEFTQLLPKTTNLVSPMDSSLLQKANASTAVNYVFAANRMGWANIDRLANFSNSRAVKFEVLVNELKGRKNNAYIALAVPRRNMFLPGYQKGNGNYAFTHGDFEHLSTLPLGDSALIVMTLETKSGLRFAVQPIQLGERTMEELTLVEGTKKEMIAALTAEL